jgi:hypothetical protein
VNPRQTDNSLLLLAKIDGQTDRLTSRRPRALPFAFAFAFAFGLFGFALATNYEHTMLYQFEQCRASWIRSVVNSIGVVV